ncbi:hypothetical protein LTR56_001666, partial [Elasticomyces elasticus]
TTMHFPNGSSAEYAYAVPLDHGLPGGTIDVGALGDMAALEQAGYRRLAYRYSGDGRPDFQLRYRYQSNWMSDDNSSADLSSSALVVPRSNSQTVNLTDQAIDDCSSTVALVTAKYSESGAIYSPFPSDSVSPTMYQWTQQGTGSASSRANRTTTVNTFATDSLGSIDVPHSISYTRSPQPSTTITDGMSISGGSGTLTSGHTISTSNIDVSVPTLTTSFESLSLSSIPAPSSPGVTSSRISGVSGTASQPSLDTSTGADTIDSTLPASGSLSKTTLLPLSTATSNDAQTTTLSGVSSPTASPVTSAESSTGLSAVDTTASSLGASDTGTGSSAGSGSSGSSLNVITVPTNTDTDSISSASAIPTNPASSGSSVSPSLNLSAVYVACNVWTDYDSNDRSKSYDIV